MNGTLVVAETRGGELRNVSFELIGAAAAVKADIGGPVKVAVIDGAPDTATASLRIRGVDEVLAIATPTTHFEPHVAQRALTSLIEQEEPQLVLLPHSIDSLGFAAAVAAVSGLGFATDVTAIGWDNGLTAQRPAYGGKLTAELGFPTDRCTLLTLRPGAFSAVGQATSCPIRRVDSGLDESAIRSRHVEFRTPVADGIDITTSDFLLSIGRGVESEQEIARLGELAEAIGATLSASRPLVDAGWVAPSRQVGQSGKTVKPRVYLALGISGAIQHLAGMRDADTIIAVNTDPEAPIFHIAHYGAVADLFEVAEELRTRFEV